MKNLISKFLDNSTVKKVKNQAVDVARKTRGKAIEFVNRRIALNQVEAVRSQVALEGEVVGDIRKIPFSLVSNDLTITATGDFDKFVKSVKRITFWKRVKNYLV